MKILKSLKKNNRADVSSPEVGAPDKAPLLYGMCSDLGAVLDSGRVVSLALGYLPQLLDCQAGGILLRDCDEGDQWRFTVRVYSQGGEAMVEGLTRKGLDSLQALSGEFVNRDDLIIDIHGEWASTSPGDRAAFADEGAQTAPFVALPLVVEGKIIGMIAAGSARGETFDADAMKVFSAVAGHVAAAIGNSRLYEQTRQEKQRLEAALTQERERDRLKSEFVSHISHELRTPLHSIKGFSKLLMEGKVTDAQTQSEFLNRIYEQSEYLSRMVEELLDVSRLEARGFRVEKERLSVGNLIRDSVRNLHGLAGEKGVELSESLPEDLPEVEADGERLRQVMTNLVSNAIKFSPEGGSVVVEGQARDNELTVQVSDNGCGISEESKPHLFDHFYQAEGSENGAGLGLHIAKQIVEAHGGRIWAESQDGEGSTLSFTLPLV
ncbi:MAG: ATP-binding protein [Chloroflexota bacterium]